MAQTATPTATASAEPARDSRAAIDFNCTTLRATVTMDNSRSTAPTTFYISEVQNGNYDLGGDWPYEVPAGETKVVRQGLSNNSSNAVWVSAFELDRRLASSEGFCGRETVVARATVSKVNCDKKTVEVTIDNTRTPAKHTWFVVQGTTRTFYGPAGSFYFQELVVPEGTRKTLQVPVLRLYRGAISITADPGDDYTEWTIFDDKIDIACLPSGNAAVAPASAASAPSSSELAQTGGVNAGLSVLGLAMLCGGVALILLTRRRIVPARR